MSEEPAVAKKSRDANRAVMREIRRARKLFGDDETAAEASFVVATANVLALVDLAAAIRESKGSVTDTQE